MTLRRCAPTTTSGCLCFVRALFVKTCKSSCVAATPLCHESLSLNAQGRGVEWSHRTSQGSCELFVSSSWRGAWGRGRGGERDERQCPHDVPCVEVVEHNRSRHDASQRRERLPPASLPPCFRTSVHRRSASQRSAAQRSTAQSTVQQASKQSTARRREAGRRTGADRSAGEGPCVAPVRGCVCVCVTRLASRTNAEADADELDPLPHRPAPPSDRPTDHPSARRPPAAKRDDRTTDRKKERSERMSERMSE